MSQSRYGAILVLSINHEKKNELNDTTCTRLLKKAATLTYYNRLGESVTLGYAWHNQWNLLWEEMNEDCDFMLAETNNEMDLHAEERHP